MSERPFHLPSSAALGVALVLHAGVALAALAISVSAPVPLGVAGGVGDGGIEIFLVHRRASAGLEARPEPAFISPSPHVESEPVRETLAGTPVEADRLPPPSVVARRLPSTGGRSSIPTDPTPAASGDGGGGGASASTAEAGVALHLGPTSVVASAAIASGIAVGQAASSGSGEGGGNSSSTAVADGNPVPRYPPAARRAGDEGLVVVRVAVDASGAASAVSVVESSGHPLLDEAALEAVAAWRFVPATRGGQAVPGEIDVPVRFVLRAAAAR